LILPTAVQLLGSEEGGGVLAGGGVAPAAASHLREEVLHFCEAQTTFTGKP